MSENKDYSRKNWWENLMESAKSKSKNAFEVIKNDLEEFKTTMSNDASSFFVSDDKIKTEENNEDSNFFKSISESYNTIKKNFNLNLTEKNTLLKPNEEKNNTSKSINKRFKMEIENLKFEEDTFIIEPVGPDYLEWLQKFDTNELKEEISNLLIQNSIMRQIYSKMVFINLYF